LRAWPELAGDAPRLADLERAWLAMMAREALDVFRLPRLTGGRIADLVRIEDPSPLFDARADGRGVILTMAHYGRLIMLLAALGAAGLRLNMLTIPIDARNPDLAPAMRRYLGTKVARLRAFIGGDWVAVGDSLKRVYEGLRRGEIWIILMDAHLAHPVTRERYPFLGGELRLATGIPRLAARTGARIVYGAVHEDGYRLRGRLCALDADPSRAMTEAVAELERDVVAQPEQWWQWAIFDYLWTPEAV
ncbi:hypothetical protein ABC977_04235, partial [Thioalkalicoccus limnaeus]